MAVPHIFSRGCRNIVDIADAKKKLRVRAMERRRGAHEAAGQEAGDKLARNVIATGIIGQTDVVSGFWSMGDEIDLLPLLTLLSKNGVICVLPVMEKKAAPLVFREWRPGIEMHRASFGMMEPTPDSPQHMPTIVVTPLLAFDAEGFRIGYGGGYYDRTLEALRAAGPVTAIGVAYEAQEVAEVPRDHFDQPLDWIVTEIGARKFDRMAKAAQGRAESPAESSS
jgi:5-formyltetrahydrofolate cyclo-ligase